MFVGGLAEKPYEGGLTGATFQGIKGKQFKDLKDGDRFFFTHEGNMDREDQKYPQTWLKFDSRISPHCFLGVRHMLMQPDAPDVRLEKWPNNNL